ncbi:MAG: hypothetical protein RI894_2458 [Bacteroidota bacterium]|jgi:hypothetical protein
MQLTGFSKLLIAVAIAALIYFGVVKAKEAGLLPSTEKTEQVTSGKTESRTSDGDNKGDGNNKGDGKSSDDNSSKPAKNTKSSGESASSFNFTPAEPVNGTLKGVVELGASGFNAFMVRIDKDKNWKLEKAEFGSSLVSEGMASGKDVKETLKNYIGTIANFGVLPKNIHFVVSSGAVKNDKIPDIVKALKQMGYVVNTVDAAQEGKLALAATVPSSYFDSAFSVDMGSGNTKISWVGGADLSSAKSVETHGAKYFQKGVSADQVFKDVQAAAAQVPANKRDVCFIVGGAPHDLVEKARQGKERYTVMKAPTAYSPDGEKQKAGVNIYKAIAEKTGCTTFVFDWDANFTIGFLLGLK